jgi:GNAT superfamily N-acetyltransferase
VDGSVDIVELRGEEIRAAFPLMRELRTPLTEPRYLEAVAEMVDEGYRLFALKRDGVAVALAGITIATNLYYGRYLWVYDLVTTESERSHGYGRKLLRYLEELAREHRCDTIALSSGLQRTDAHRFYEARMGYERASFVFCKELR